MWWAAAAVAPGPAWAATRTPRARAARWARAQRPWAAAPAGIEHRAVGLARGGHGLVHAHAHAHVRRARVLGRLGCGAAGEEVVGGRGGCCCGDRGCRRCTSAALEREGHRVRERCGCRRGVLVRHREIQPGERIRRERGSWRKLAPAREVEPGEGIRRGRGRLSRSGWRLSTGLADVHVGERIRDGLGDCRRAPRREIQVGKRVRGRRRTALARRGEVDAAERICGRRCRGRQGWRTDRRSGALVRRERHQARERIRGRAGRGRLHQGCGWRRLHLGGGDVRVRRGGSRSGVEVCERIARLARLRLELLGQARERIRADVERRGRRRGQRRRGRGERGLGGRRGRAQLGGHQRVHREAWLGDLDVVRGASRGGDAPVVDAGSRGLALRLRWRPERGERIRLLRGLGGAGSHGRHRGQGGAAGLGGQIHRERASVGRTAHAEDRLALAAADLHRLVTDLFVRDAELRLAGGALDDHR